MENRNFHTESKEYFLRELRSAINEMQFALPAIKAENTFESFTESRFFGNAVDALIKKHIGILNSEKHHYLHLNSLSKCAGYERELLLNPDMEKLLFEAAKMKIPLIYHEKCRHKKLYKVLS